MGRRKKGSRSSKKKTKKTRLKKSQRVNFSVNDVALAVKKADISKDEQLDYVTKIYQQAGVPEKRAKNSAYQALYRINNKYPSLAKAAKGGNLADIKQYLPADTIDDRADEPKKKTKKPKKESKDYETEPVKEEPTMIERINYAVGTMDKLATIGAVTTKDTAKGGEHLGRVQRDMEVLEQDVDAFTTYVDELKQNYVEAKQKELDAAQEKINKERADLETLL